MRQNDIISNEDEEDNFYNEAYLHESMEDDEISGMEEGFMLGYLK